MTTTLNKFTKTLSRYQKVLRWILLVLVTWFFVFFNLTSFPEPWFDEGSHLHVPKTLVKYGVYADYSSDGFRYYGPTIGVGPTVMLPIAAMFKIFGIGLLQARIVVGLYMVAAIYTFYKLVKDLTNLTQALLATLLLVSSRSVLFLTYGRQILGEVPGLFFLILGLVLWFKNWGNNNWKRLALIGLLFGLAMITKYQYLLFLAPTLILSWLLDIFYYKTTQHKNFLIPGIVAAGSFALWQGITLQFMGPATAIENFALLRASAEGAAFNFDLNQISQNLTQLVSRSVYLGALLPALFYGLFISLPRNREGQKWSTLFLLMALNLIWFVVASIGWVRYAFLGLSLAGIFIVRLFYDLTNGFKFNIGGTFKGLENSLFSGKYAFQWTLAIWLFLIFSLPMVKNVMEIYQGGSDAVEQMAAYLDENIPQNAVIETWDPEIGFFTDHNFHYPPNALLAEAVEQVYSNGEPVNGHYTFVQEEKPEYILNGEFSKWVDIYPVEQLNDQYEWVIKIGDYDLYRRVK
jgi:4-amino-4-deoxy-L-arabinose transferase-like glycosyltransferase